MKNGLLNLLNEKIFPFVQKPARYIGNEHGITTKDISNIPIKFALAFPDFYELGMSHIGMGIIYDILNSKDYIACERVYLPYQDMNLKLKENDIPLFSLESYEEVRRFDIVGFSLQYELSYVNLLLMLELAKIPLFSSERDISDNHAVSETEVKAESEDYFPRGRFGYPLVGAGGPCVFNPLPMNDFMDFFIIGDGEEVSVDVCDTVLSGKKRVIKGELKLNDFRDYVKTKLSKLRGIYVPGYSQTVKKAIVNDLNSINYIKKNVAPLIETVHNRLSVEIARGCSSGCRFCQAGYIYRPVRERKKETVFEIIKNGIESTGLGEISLSSLSTGDYSEIDGLLNDLAEFSGKRNISMSFPSMRIGSLSDNIMKKTAEVKKTNFTLAPEAGTQRLRDIINKNISEADLIKEAKSLSDRGFKSLKLYFMIGLPYERLSDIEGIRDLVVKIKTVSKKLNITVNINNFVPKPHTPFQWFPINDLRELNYKINYLKKLLRPLSVNIRYQNPEVSLVEGLLSRGDKSVSSVIYNAYLLGASYSSDIKLFSFDLWDKAVKKTDPSLYGKYLYSEKGLDEVLPWDFIDTAVEKNFLKKEFEKAAGINTLYLENKNHKLNYYDGDKNKLFTENCRSVCYLCGVCDFKDLSPVYSSKEKNDEIHKNKKSPSAIDISQTTDKTAVQDKIDEERAITVDNAKDNTKIKLLFRYSKKGMMRYLGHLETVKIFMRVFKILDMSICYSNSEFSPKPKISYSDPIPFMAESDSLFISVVLNKKTGTIMSNMITEDTIMSDTIMEDTIMSDTIMEDFIARFNRLLPEGLKIMEIRNVDLSFKIPK